MFENITQAYDLTDATGEILIMLAVAFLSGILFHWAFFCKGYAERKKSTIMDAEDLKIIEGIGPKIE